MWMILSPIWSKLWGARVFLTADCVRRILCLGHARLCALPAQRIRLSCQRSKIHLAPASLLCRAAAHLVTASGGFSVWVMHVYVRSPRRESALRAKVFLAADCVRRAFCLGHARLCALPAQKARLSCQQPKILLARGTVQGGKQSAHGCCRLRQTDFLLGACTSVAPPAWPHSCLHHFIYPLFDTKRQ